MVNLSPGLLKVSGSDAKKLLQGQLTCDVNDITPTQSRLGAHCNPQGRIISLFYLFNYQDDYYLQMPRDMIAIALKALKKYAIFFKVELTDASDESSIIGNLDSHLPTFLENGVAMIYPETSGVFLPHEINLPQLNGISFNKGCYTGQEIIARMQYRAKLKNQLHLATCEDVTLTRGKDIYDEKGIAGKIVDYVNVKNNESTLLIITNDTSQPLFLDSARTQRVYLNR